MARGRGRSRGLINQPNENFLSDTGTSYSHIKGAGGRDGREKREGNEVIVGGRGGSWRLWREESDDERGFKG